MLGEKSRTHGSLGSNAGFLAGDIDAGADNRWIGSAAIGRGLSNRVSAFFEGYGFAGGQGESDLFLDSGLTFALSEQLQFDFRVAKQIRGSLRESHVGIGVARRWNLLR